MILTKNQERSKRDKENIQVRKNRYIKLNKTYYCVGKFNATLSLCKVPECQNCEQ